MKEKQNLLEVLDAEILSCSKCEDLCYSRTKPVPGKGNIDAEILLVGEAPGKDEDKQGEPFIGKSGKLLASILSAVNIRREDVYIDNTCKCKPPQNRTPTVEEIKNCHDFLDRRIAIVKPKYILCLGQIAAQRILNTDDGISKLRGKMHMTDTHKVFVTYHPSYCLRRPDSKKLVHEDMVFFTKEMEKDRNETK